MKTQTIVYYHKNSDKIAYKKLFGCKDFWCEYTYDDEGNEITYKNSNDVFLIQGKKVTKEEFEAFENPSEKSVLTKIAELEKQLSELKQQVNSKLPTSLKASEL